MEGQLIEAHSFPAQRYAESFFQKLPLDSRFLQCTYQKFMPSSSIDGRTIEFCLDRYDVGNVYLIQDTNIEVQVSITKNDGTLPLASAQVSTVNNLLHSMFESVRLIINDNPITISPSSYGYKCYFSNVLTYSTEVKAAQLQTQGFYPDTSEHMGPVVDNGGFTDRMSLFRKNFELTTEYKKEGTVLFGRLMHDLVSSTTGLPPHTKIKFELDRSEDAFVIMCPESDNEKYKLKILNITLYVPVAQLSSSVFSEMNSILTRKNEPKAFAIHYRRLEVRPISLPRNKLEYNSDGLFRLFEKT